MLTCSVTKAPFGLFVLSLKRARIGIFYDKYLTYIYLQPAPFFRIRSVGIRYLDLDISIGSFKKVQSMVIFLKSEGNKNVQRRRFYCRIYVMTYNETNDIGRSHAEVMR